MAEFIQDESVITPVKSPMSIDTMYNQSVIFEFNGNVNPIACDIAYLYAEGKNFQENYVEIANIENENGAPLNLFGDNNGLNTAIFKKKYRFIDTIRYLIFKYGLKNEYYKNIHGVWIDMSAIRPYFDVSNFAVNSPFTGPTWNNGVVDNSNLETSVYKKICDNPYFDGTHGNDNNPIVDNAVITNINILPACRYITKDPKQNCADGRVSYISRGDGQYTLEKINKLVFRECNETNDVTNENIIWFTYELANHSTGEVASGNYSNNNHHKFDDVLVTFVDSENHPYTDLNNLFIVVNGMFVDYERHPNFENKIYLNNIVKYADYQIKGIKEGHSLSSYGSIIEDEFGNRIINYDIPGDVVGYVWTFDITINKWKDISISHFETPLSNISTLKQGSGEDKKTFWLTTGMTFSSEIDKDKCILICGNEIVSKDSWDVDKKDKHKVLLKNASVEFDIIYSEVYRRLKEYLEATIDHTINNAPRITDFIHYYYTTNGNSLSIDGVEDAINDYAAAVDDFVAAGGEYNYHYMKSAINIVKQQFVDRQYAIVKFDIDESHNYTIEVRENHDDIKFNVPYRDRMQISNWGVDDLIVVNGINHRFENEYENVFKPVAKWYLTDISNTLDDVNGYKLEICKHYIKENKYLKLNYSQMYNIDNALRRGDSVNERFFIRKSSGEYEELLNVTEFDKSYIRLDEIELEAGPQRDVKYFTCNINTSEYELVEPIITEFSTNRNYYKLVFNKQYYLLKR